MGICEENNEDMKMRSNFYKLMKLQPCERIADGRSPLSFADFGHDIQ